MVNLTYGYLTGDMVTSHIVDPGTPYGIALGGTDLIATLPDGTVVAYNPGDIAWILTCTALVLMMVPGLGYLYSGLVRRKNALTLLLFTLLCLSVIAVQWWFWGYSLTFSPSGGPFMGDLEYFAFRNVLEQPVPGANNKIPNIVYAIYQCMFAAVVPAIAIGAAAERGRVGPAIIFLFIWSSLVYAPVARTVWSPAGFAFQQGVLDYAGGGPIEIVSGVTGLAYSIYLGKRRGFGTERLAFKPHNVSNIVLGTVLLWFGWLGFNGGSTFAANLKAGLAIVNTNLAGSTGGLTWMLMDYRLDRRWSAVGFCTGAICGLVAITPAAGYIGAPAAAFIGIMASVVSNLLTSLKGWFRFDDAMDIYACHGVAGIVGLIFTGVFAQASVTANDAFTVIPGGWLDQNYRQVGIQLVYIIVVWLYTFFMTYAIMIVIDHIPYCHFRCSEEAEIIGVDEDQCGEFAYDFVGLTEYDNGGSIRASDLERAESRVLSTNNKPHSINEESNASGKVVEVESEKV